MKNCLQKKLVDFFRAVCDEHRHIILEIIKNHKNINAKEINKKIKLSQPTLSHHLKILVNAGIIKSNKLGKEVRYELNEEKIHSCCHSFLGKFCSKQKK